MDVIISFVVLFVGAALGYAFGKNSGASEKERHYEKVIEVNRREQHREVSELRERHRKELDNLRKGRSDFK